MTIWPCGDSASMIPAGVEAYFRSGAAMAVHFAALRRGEMTRSNWEYGASVQKRGLILREQATHLLAPVGRMLDLLDHKRTEASRGRTGQGCNRFRRCVQRLGC